MEKWIIIISACVLVCIISGLCIYLFKKAKQKMAASLKEQQRLERLEQYRIEQKRQRFIEQQSTIKNEPGHEQPVFSQPQSRQPNPRPPSSPIPKPRPSSSSSKRPSHPFAKFLRPEHVRKRDYEKLIRQHSQLVAKLQRRAQQIKAEAKKIPSSLTLQVKRNSLAAFNTYDPLSALREYLEKNEAHIWEIFDDIDFNDNLLSEFDTELSLFSQSRKSQDFSSIPNPDNMDFDQYDELFTAICNSLRPTLSTEWSITVEWSYHSPGGKSNHSNQVTYSADEIEAHLAKLSHASKSKSFAYQQRRLMTSTLRYQILRRDGFRCVLCGRGSEDGIKLQVDHVVPVSKGGLTVEENLRTLCQDCNRGKTDSYDPNGPN